MALETTFSGFIAEANAFPKFASTSRHVFVIVSSRDFSEVTSILITGDWVLATSTFRKQLSKHAQDYSASLDCNIITRACGKGRFLKIIILFHLIHFQITRNI